MADFQYAAKNPQGKTVEGTISADDKSDAVNQLRNQDLIVLRVDGGRRAKKSSSGTGSKRPRSSFFKAKPSASKAELTVFTRQLSTMIGAGISLLESLEVLCDQADTPGMRACLEKLTAELRGGADLSAAMETCPRVFSPLYISMITAAEASGQMDIILVRLAEYVEASEELKREIRSAMTYPVISMVLVIGITLFLMIGVVPGFKEVFDGLGAELPGLTLTVLAISDWLVAKWYVGLSMLFAAFVAFKLSKKSEQGALFWDKVVLKLPVFGMLMRKVGLARFSRTFATLIRSGVPIMATLDIVADTSGNRVIANAVNESKESVRNGNMLSEPLSRAPVFPPMVVKMIAIGERSGALEQLLEKIAEFYDSEVKAMIKSLTSLIEPLLICAMGGIVGTVILAVFLPILNIIGTLSS